MTLTASLQAFGGQFFSAEAIAVGNALVVGIDRTMSEAARSRTRSAPASQRSRSRRQRELDLDHVHTVLDRPEIVDRDVEAALRGSDTADDEDRPAARFQRDPAARTSSAWPATPSGARSACGGGAPPRRPDRRSRGCRGPVNRTLRSWRTARARSRLPHRCAVGALGLCSPS